MIVIVTEGDFLCDCNSDCDCQWLCLRVIASVMVILTVTDSDLACHLVINTITDSHYQN